MTITHVIVDIDGTIADCTHRLRHIQKNPKDWDGFFSYDEMMQDRPILPVIRAATVASMVARGAHIVTGRPERTRRITDLWLDRHASGLSDEITSLTMRPDDDRRDDHIIKPEMIARLTPYADPTSVVIFEDRSRVVKALRACGYTVFQVADGDY